MVCCHNHSQRSKNKPLGCVLGTGGWRHARSHSCLCAGYCDPLWFILSADDSPHIICNGQDIQYHSVEIQGWGKNRKSPHQEARPRNRLFDGYMFQRHNDGVSPESFKNSPYLWFGVGWLHTWLTHCVLLHNTQKVREFNHAAASRLKN